MSDPREDKLPRWARELLGSERRKASDAQAKLAEHLGTVVESPIWYGGYDNPVYLPERYGYQEIHFRVGGTDRLFDEVAVGLNGDRVEVRGGRGLILEPVASKVVVVKLGGV
ncbi:DUF7239 family protein [Antrihabitans cavernicola]|uniref:Uncharacterized protein n=1 Tax=Antrihabitans cavernicola TaxID=2495913 RepID=A0A5A7S9I7_9NOCA|nr:hypothetical protein [Spelaeibacter cavernicola]KAA0021822.1 hypothetical protein FOY51_15600 [Spelaeibacter cavernicola]